MNTKKSSNVKENSKTIKPPSKPPTKKKGKFGDRGVEGNKKSQARVRPGSVRRRSMASREGSRTLSGSGTDTGVLNQRVEYPGDKEMLKKMNKDPRYITLVVDYMLRSDEESVSQENESSSSGEDSKEKPLLNVNEGTGKK